MIQTPSAPSRKGRVLLVAMAGLAVAVALALFSSRPVWAQELGAHRQSRASLSPRPPAPWVEPTFAWAWGDETAGQLCNAIDFPDALSTPVPVLNLSEVTAIAGGLAHSLAAKRDGTVWACGYNLYGAPGNGSPSNSATPVQVLNLSGVTAVAAGGTHSLAVKSDGTVWAWGYNGQGRLGDGTTTDRSTPVQVLNLSGVRAVAAGGYHSLALKSDGTVWAWGFDGDGQLGDGPTTTTEQHTPVQVLNLSGVTAIAAGGSHSLAVKSDGTVWAWGQNVWGQLGDGTTTDRNTPVPVLTAYGTPFSSVIRIAAGQNQSLAIVRVQPTFVEPPYLAVNKLLAHPANRFRPPLFNLQIDGATVRANVTSGSTGLLEVSSGNHIVGETGGTGTDLDGFTAVIGGDCAPDGTVNLIPGDKKVCTIINYDHFGGCGRGQCCRQPGEGTQPCKECALSGNC